LIIAGALGRLRPDPGLPVQTGDTLGHPGFKSTMRPRIKEMIDALQLQFSHYVFNKGE
jgi:hypothetical protein